VETLSHLHRAAEATRNRFHDALANYQDRNGKILQPLDAEQDPEDGKEWFGAERQDMNYSFPYRAGRTMGSMAEPPQPVICRFESMNDVPAMDEAEVISPSQYGGRCSPQMLFGGSSSASSPYGGGAAQNLDLQQAIRRTHSIGMLQLSAGHARSRARSESPGRHFSASLPAPLGNIFAETDSQLLAFAPAATAHAPWRHSEASTSSPSPPFGYPAMPGRALHRSSAGPEQPSVLGRVPSSAALEPLNLGTQTLRLLPQGEDVPPFLAHSLSSPALNSPLAGSPQACGASRGQMSEPAHKRGLARLGGSRLQRLSRSLHVDLADETRRLCVIPFRSQGSMAAMYPS